jgi:quercetin dioxygenase-like cupin family protein
MIQRFNENLLMKTRFHLLCATMAFVIASIALIGGAASASAQDPVVVNSKTIKVKFENERVRVLEAELPPGVKEQVHSHPAYVIYVLAGGKVRNYTVDGKITEAELKTGEVLYREPLTHAAENIGNTTMHMILVELKTSAR